MEKECLRVDNKGNLALTPHPKSLGSPLMHPEISTDFSESQLELITPTFFSEKKVLNYLKDLHRYLYEKLDDELLWPFSTPAVLPSEDKIPIANYGTSNLAKKEHTYREGLSVRYGRKMQTLSGIHYNFSFSNQFFSLLASRFGGEANYEYISSVYLHIVRNFLRLGWLNTYLFGSTPAVDKSYQDSPTPPDFKSWGKRTYIGMDATSIRMSEFGYFTKIQSLLSISFDHIDHYIRDIEHATNTPSSYFEKLSKDLNLKGFNTNLLQSYAEYYSKIRPKGDLKLHEDPLKAFRLGGIYYLEARNIDLNPLSSDGIEEDQLQFLHLLFLYCLFQKSPYLSHEEHQINYANQNLVALKGRKAGLKLQTPSHQLKSLKEWGKEILEGMEQIALFLDKNLPKSPNLLCLKNQLKKIENPEETPSQKVMEELIQNKLDFVELGTLLSKKYREEILKRPLNIRLVDQWEKSALKSLKEKEDHEAKDGFLLEGFEDMEISTQMILREAEAREIDVEIIDRKDNFLKLTKGKKEEFIKQATCTRLDSYIAYLKMENKHVTKQILEKAGFSVPKGGHYSSKENALKSYPEWQHLPLVVKPNFTNYGIGIHFIKPHDENGYKEAVESAFHFGEEIIVEEFWQGNEYRFLIIGDRCEAVCQRLPANVIGDGVHSIQFLVKEKNMNPKMFKPPWYHLKLGKTEKAFLQKQNLESSSIIEKGRRVFLRANSNVSTGGDPVDVTDLIPKDYQTVALNAVKAAQVVICGVDMIIPDLMAPALPKSYTIIELNYNPSLHIHRYVVEGTPHYVEKAVLDALGF